MDGELSSLLHLRSTWIRALSDCYTRQGYIWMGAFQLATVTAGARQEQTPSRKPSYFSDLGGPRHCGRTDGACGQESIKCASCIRGNASEVHGWGPLTASYTRQRGSYGWRAFKRVTPQKSMDTGPFRLLHQTGVHMDGGLPACYRYGRNTPRTKTVTETKLFFRPRGAAPLRPHRRCLWARIN